MGFFELFILAVSLSADAFAAAVCKGLATGEKTSGALKAGIWFGGFQALMPLIGWFLGYRFKSLITSFDHWIAFGLLLLIGANMIRESLFGKDESDCGDMSVRTMLLLAIATSIDALAVGVTFAFLEVSVVPAVLLIGVTTFVLSAAGFRLGGVFGIKYKKYASVAGGIALILLGTKILLEHLGVI